MADEKIESDKNFDFVQVSRSYLREWRSLTRKNPVASEILMFLVENMGKSNAAVVCSYHTLQEVTGLSRSTVSRAIATLKKDNWIEAVKIGSATAYAVNARVFWRAGRNQKKYAIFQASVIAAETEQPEAIHTEREQPLRHIPFVGDNERAIVGSGVLPPPDQGDIDLD